MLKSKFVERNVSQVSNVGSVIHGIASILVLWSSLVVVNGFFAKDFFLLSFFSLLIFNQSFPSGEFDKVCGKFNYFSINFDVNS